MNFNLAAMTQRAKPRRAKWIVLPAIHPTVSMAADLAAIYLLVVNAWKKAAAEQILPAYTAATKAIADHGGRNMVKVADDLSDVNGSVNGAGEQVTRLLVSITPMIRRWATKAEKWHRLKWAASIASAAGPDVLTLMAAEDVHETIEAIIARNVALIRSVAEETRARIADIILRGFQGRTETREVARQIAAGIDMSRRRALGIASDQNVKLASALDTRRMVQAGIDIWKWRHSGKVHFRPEHKARDGNIYTWQNAPADLPGELPFCGCAKQAMLNLAALG